VLKEESGQLGYAETADGNRFYGKQFISNIHPAVLIKLVDGNTLRPAYKNRIEGLPQTISSFMLNLVLKPGTIPMQRYNTYWNASEDAFAAAHYQPYEWPANYTTFFTEDVERPGFAESVSLLTYMHYSEVAHWADTHNRAGNEHDRGQSYEQFKELRAEQLLQKVFERFPELKGNIVAHAAATPLTYRDYTGTPDGSLYGIMKDVNKPAETTIATRTRIPNLLLTGQNVNLHGVLGVSITAVATCAELLGMDYLLKQIKR
jgi:all-trans-retinol 13,14-reductase